MKLRKTIYPLALIIAIPLVFLVFYILNQGKFEKTTEAESFIENANGEAVAILHYHLKWKGLGKPVLHKVLFEGKPNMDIHAYIVSETAHTSEELIVKEVDAGQYAVDFKERALHEKHVTLMMEVDEKYEDMMIHNDSFHVHYQTFGITREHALTIKETDKP